MTATADPTSPGTEAGRVSRALDPVLKRVDDLERITDGMRADERIGDDVRDLAVRYVDVVRAVLPLITGWGAARAGLLEATDQAISAVARHSRIPGQLDPPAVDVSGVTAGILADLVAYADSVRKAVADEDISRLLEIQRAVSKAFGAGFNARALGVGDPAREPDPDPEPEPTEPGPSFADVLRGLLGAVPAEVWVAVAAVAVALTALVIWSPR